MARSLAVLISVVSLLAACQSPPTSEEGRGAEQTPSGTGYEEVLAAIEGLTGQARTDRLTELAEEEGGLLSLYTSLTSDVEVAVGEAFEDAYDIDVAVYRADSETVVQRLVQEADAGVVGADAVETNGPELETLGNEGVLATYDSEYEDALVEGSEAETWTATRFNKFAISWNTDAVGEGDQPASWEALADPEWDGQLALEVEDVDWFKTLWEYWLEQGKSEEEIQGLFEDMARGGLFVRGHTVMGELTAAGEFGVAASNYSYIVQNLVDDGAPIAWEPATEPLLSRPNGVGVVKNAQHPATALLFADWILTDGQEVIVEGNLDPARDDLNTTSQYEEIVVDVADLVANVEEWRTRYEELANLGQEVE